MLLNRELSWLDFNHRVLTETCDPVVPIEERPKFSAIFSNNLDEFYMVRVDAVMQEMKADPESAELLENINEKVRALIREQEEISATLLRSFAGEFTIVGRSSYTAAHKEILRKKFQNEIFPVLTPMAVDFSRPFPLLSSKHIYIAAMLEVEEEQRLALVQAPPVLGRLIKIEKGVYTLLEDIIDCFCSELFGDYQVRAKTKFRILRSGDLSLTEDISADLLNVVEEAVKHRKWGEVMRLDIEAGCHPWLLDTLTASFGVHKSSVFTFSHSLDYTYFFQLPIKKSSKLVQKTPIGLEKKNLFKCISQNDIFLHHPYESFEPVVKLISDAAKDKDVLAIKQTLYRVSGNSPIVRALGEAAEAGKQVTVLVELLARFDEENNIAWAKALEKKGAHVIYGVYGLKTHSKITMIVRKEKGGIKRYVHLGTGNYNDQTSKLYTDMAYMTAREDYGSDATAFFNMISGFMKSTKTLRLTAAPHDLRDKLTELIEKETLHGAKGRITAKMNSLLDRDIIEKLYRASRAGVKIRLIVRGICVLVPGVAGLSENITVKSIIGEFLEHSRIFSFKHSGTFLSSADWMPRNLDRRIELMFRISDKAIEERILSILKLYLADDTKSWNMLSDGTYIKEQKNTVFAHRALRTIKYDSHKDFVAEINKLIH
ncbi:MAG: polyphosphate kinase 1 [Bacillota bacterium]|nr:polyphosphate kinase 1 [Bacillota bacterium]